jgi:hypothetical protein
LRRADRILCKLQKIKLPRMSRIWLIATDFLVIGTTAIFWIPTE